MPKIRPETRKESILYIRVTRRIKDLVKNQAAQEGITPSEWLRKLIIKELRERNALPPLLQVPEIEE